MGGLESAIEVEGLSFRYGKTPILRDINLTIPREGFSVVLGRNGSGKSTLLRIMAGVADRWEGRVTVFGKDLRDLSPSWRAKVVGYLPQQHRPVFPFSVEDVVLTGRASYIRFLPGERDRRKVGEVLEQTGISHLAGRPFTELSGGEQQLVMIARVLAQEPRIVLLDEPTSHLDFFNQARLLGLVRDLVRSGLTVAAVVHDPNAAFLHGDHFFFLKNGCIHSLDPALKPWDPQFLSTVYDMEVCSVPHGNRALIIPVVEGKR